MTDVHSEAASGSRSARLDRAIRDLLVQAPELEAAAVVSFDGLPMAAALPPSMDEDRVAAMSAALLSLGERAAEGLGRGQLSQVYIEGDDGTVFLVSADDEAVLVAVAAKGAKAGMMLYEVRRAAGVVAGVLRSEEAPEPPVAPVTLVPVQARPEPAAEPAAATSYAATSPAPWGVPASAVQAAPRAGAGSPARASTAPSRFPSTTRRPTRSRSTTCRPTRFPHYDLPQYDLPRYDLPVDLPQYDLPVDLPVQAAPVQNAAPVQAEPVPYAAAPEPVWPLHTPTGSVMPGGGVPPSTWS
jgi:predicted regulator of Ras-like GTPase activity (Roadblock/LC7/MglB family)